MNRTWLIPLVTCMTLSPSVWGGVPQVIHPTTGAPIALQNPQTILVHFDQGPLGALSNGQARAFVEAMMAIWEEASGGRVRFAVAGGLPEDVTVDNLADYIDGTICSDDFPPLIPSMQVGESPIIFDHDGAIIDLLAGEGASDKIVGKAAYRCYAGDLDSPSSATQAFVILNGRFLDGAPDPFDLATNVYAGIILHELGHFLGLHHSMVNDTLFNALLFGDSDPTYARFIPVMYPLVLRDSPAATVLKPDDVAALQSLYARDDDTFSSLNGVIVSEDAAGVRGVNVVARRRDDPLCYSVSGISGRYCTPLVDDFGRRSLLGELCQGDSVTQGTYAIEGLLPGEYTIEVSEMTSIAGARKNMFPKSVTTALPGAAEYYNLRDRANELSTTQSFLHLSAETHIQQLDIVLGNDGANAVKSIDVTALPANATSDCQDDPVDYRLFLDSVVATEVSDAGVETNLSSPALRTTALGGEGCQLVPGGRRSSPMPWLSLVMICAVFAGRVARRRVGWCLVCLLALMAVHRPAMAETSLPTDPAELVATAGEIFYGTCQALAVVTDKRGFTVTEVTFAIDEAVKGQSHDEGYATMTFRMMGSRLFHVGESMILFLYPESRWGLTSPVGGGQGVYRVVPDDEGVLVVRNPFVSAPSTSGKARTSVPAMIPTEMFLEAVRTLLDAEDVQRTTGDRRPATD